MTNNYFIYKLEVGDYFYWGSSKSDNRIHRHKNASYNIKNYEYEYKLYKKIRQLCPNPKHFYSFIHFEKYYENLDIDTKKYMENLLLQKYKDNPYSLNIQVRIQLTTFNEYRKLWHNKRINCPICNKEMNKSSLGLHKRRKH